MNYMVMFVISITITSLIFLICVFQSFQIRHKLRPRKIQQRPVSFSTSYGTNAASSVNFSSNRF